MYGGSLNGIIGAIAVFFAIIGAALVGLAWAFVVWFWPWLKAWLHAATA
jgi:hypothetical protein